MLSETILIKRGSVQEITLPMYSVILPDARLFLPYIEDRKTHDMLLFSHEQAEELLLKISARDLTSEVVQEPFAIDVPDLRPLANEFPCEEKEILLTFWYLYDALVNHFLPGATQSRYGKNGKVLGKKYAGLGWFSSVLKEVSFE
jgi:hypothetical protein